VKIVQTTGRVEEGGIILADLEELRHALNFYQASSLFPGNSSNNHSFAGKRASLFRKLEQLISEQVYGSSTIRVRNICEIRVYNMYGSGLILEIIDLNKGADHTGLLAAMIERPRAVWELSVTADIEALYGFAEFDCSELVARLRASTITMPAPRHLASSFYNRARYNFARGYSGPLGHVYQFDYDKSNGIVCRCSINTEAFERYSLNGRHWYLLESHTVVGPVLADESGLDWRTPQFIVSLTCEPGEYGQSRPINDQAVIEELRATHRALMANFPNASLQPVS
jgi:hypothetical protein